MVNVEARIFRREGDEMSTNVRTALLMALGIVQDAMTVCEIDSSDSNETLARLERIFQYLRTQLDSESY